MLISDRILIINRFTKKSSVPVHRPHQKKKLTGVSQRQRPQTQVRRRVRDAAQRELDRVDRLVHHNVAEIELQRQTSIVETIELLSHLAAAVTTVTASVATAASSLLVMHHFSIVVVHIRPNTL